MKKTMNEYDALHQMVLELYDVGLIKDPKDRQRYAFEKLTKCVNRISKSLNRGTAREIKALPLFA